MSISLVEIGILLAGTAGVWLGSGWLESAAEDLSAYYGLPEVVQGSVVTAVGSSFPDLATVVVAAVFANSIDLGVGAIVGSAIFNILVIPSLAGLFAKGDIQSNRTLVYKEAQFYMLAVSVLVITFSMAVIYNPVASTDIIDGAITRPLALIPLAMYGLYLFIQMQDTADHDADPDDAEGINVGEQWTDLLVALVLILVAVHGLVHSVEVIGTELGVPEFIMGVTILAGATSLPDALVSVRAARDGRGVASLANVLGSNTFDLLVAIPVGVLIIGSKPINFEMAVPMFAVLTLATIMLFTTLRTDLELSTPEAVLLLGTSVVFVAWVVLETVSTAVDFLPN